LCDRYLVDASDFHANGWTFVWTLQQQERLTSACAMRTARCLRIDETEKVTTCAQRQRFLIALANAPEIPSPPRRKGIHVITPVRARSQYHPAT